MLSIRNWGIRTRLLLAFAGVLLPYLGLAGVGVVAFEALWRSIGSIQEEVFQDLKRTVDFQVHQDRMVYYAKDYLQLGGSAQREQMGHHLKELRESLSLLETTPFQVEEERALLKIVKDRVEEIDTCSLAIMSLPDPRSDPNAPAIMNKLVQLTDEVDAALNRLAQIHLTEIDKGIATSSRMIQRVSWAGTLTPLLSMAGAAAFALLFATWLSRPIQAIARSSRRLAEGDLSQRVEARTGGELGEMAQAFNEMAERLEQSAIENARLYHEVGQRAERIAAINRLTKVISSSLDLGTVYATFAKELKQLTPYDRMGIVISDEGGKTLRLFHLASDRLNGAAVGRAWSSKGTGIEWVMSNRQPHIEHDLAEARLFAEDGILLKEGVRSTIRLPLIAKGKTVGALFVDDLLPHRYTERDLELLVPLGEQLAIAIENARLHDELERKVEERTALLQETQAQLIQSGKLAAVGTLAAGVAHELNQPLMVIRGYAQELLGDGRLADEEIREDLRRIEGQTTRMVAIINHLRDFSRQSKGTRQVIDLNQVVTGALAFLGQQLKTKNIAVVQELVPALPPVWADPLQIEQVLLNLITNARDAMEEAGMGTIIIRTELAQGSRVALSVTDTGPGIPEKLQGRIFDPFFTTKEVGKGTGLGLSICHGIVADHGGELRMESPVPVPDSDRGAARGGARFTIVLPLSLRVESERDRA